MLSSTSIVASSSRALPTTTLGRGQRQEVPSRRATSTMSTRALTTTHRCRHHFVDAPSPRRLLRASPRHRFSRPVVASASSSSSGDRDDAVLKSIVEAAAAAAKAARASEASAASTTSFASVSSSDEASSSGLRGATVSPRRTRLITFTCNKCDARTERSINPTAWDKGLVFVQCGTCQAWHKVADAAGLIDEVVFAPLDESAALLVRSDRRSTTMPSPELAFESADEPHGLVPIERKGEEEEE